jgi:hypothetical protein
MIESRIKKKARSYLVTYNLILKEINSRKKILIPEYSLLDTKIIPYKSLKLAHEFAYQICHHS